MMEREILLKHILAWRGTPFLVHHAQRGVGVDCVRFAAAVYQEMGLCPPVPWPHYELRSTSGGLDLLCATVESLGVFERKELPVDCELGDLLVFSSSRGFQHMGIYVGDQQFYHVLDGVGLVMSSLCESQYSKRLRLVYRLKNNRQ